MKQSAPSTTIWTDPARAQLAEVLCSIADISTMQQFLRDVMTEKEIAEISARLRVAQMLQDGQTYTEVIAETKLSSRTVARISDWIKNGAGGYAAVLEEIKKHHDHTPPARA